MILYWNFTHLHPLIWFSNQFGCPNWSWQKNCQRKVSPRNHSYLKHASVYHIYVIRSEMTLLYKVRKSKRFLFFHFLIVSWMSEYTAKNEWFSFNTNHTPTRASSYTSPIEWKNVLPSVIYFFSFRKGEAT